MARQLDFGAGIQEKSADDTKVVIGAPADDVLSVEIGSDDPRWLKDVREAFPTNTSFHALIRFHYAEYRKTFGEKKSRGMAIVAAGKKVFPRENLHLLLQAVDEGGPLAHVIDDALEPSDETEQLELDILSSLDGASTKGD